jgi:hypothetical protein
MPFHDYLQPFRRYHGVGLQTRKAITWATIAPLILLSVFVGLTLKPKTHAASQVLGQSYLTCDNPGQFLTSPWTYHALSSGSQSYTVAQYQALSGYGTTLPPLPSYISSEATSTTAAVIFAPGSQAWGPAYQFPGTPIIYFFEGGAYGPIGFQSVSGDEFIGGSAAGFPEPTFDDANGADGIDASNSTSGYNGGGSTLAAPAGVGATSITTTSAIGGFFGYVTMADGNTYQVANHSGTSITLQSGLTAAQSSGTPVYANSNPPLAKVATSASAGATTLTLTSSNVPLVQWSEVVIGDHVYQISAISGSQSGYTITVPGLDVGVSATTPVFNGYKAGGVTVSYLDIAHDLHSTTATISTGAGWNVMHNNIHDGYRNPGEGIAIDGNSGHITIEYNCFSKMGVYAVNIGGVNDIFDYNEVFETNYEPDPGCGCSGVGKWWGSLNADIVGNAFVNDAPSGGGAVWLDNGNSGTLVQGNYFDKSYGTAFDDETGYNVDIQDNMFVDSGWGSGSGTGDNNDGAINLNQSGGFHVPGSRYDNQFIISNNQFINDWMPIDIWQSGSRSCHNSGESAGNGTDDAYCSGGYPNSQLPPAGGQYYFSHVSDSVHGFAANLAADASAGATTVLVANAQAINDQIGFADPSSTTTSSTTNVTTLTGSQTIAAASTASFPASGQLRVGTSAAWTNAEGSYTGAILNYTGKTASSFTGVSLARGTGTLSGPILQVQPYRVVSQTCYTNDCAVTITPALAGAVAAGTTVTNAGTCQLFATSVATPTSPLAPSGDSYFDGCMWGTAHVAVSGNSFVFDPTYIASHAPLVGGGTTTTCTAAHANSCGTLFMAYQGAGEPPYGGNFIYGNAMMSNSLTACPDWDSGCTTNPLKNINANSNPPDSPAGNNEQPSNNLWSNNAYYGTSPEWEVYTYGTCGTLPSDATTGKSMPSSPDACSNDFAHWQSNWQQDAGSTLSATIPPSPSGTPTPTATPTVTPTPTASPTPTPSGKVGDLNGDGQVNIFDLSILLSAWGTANATADLNHDGTVNIFDLSIFLSHWGT